MIDFKECSINSRELIFLTGLDMPAGVYEKLLSKRDYKNATDLQLRGMRFKVADIIKIGALKLTQSTDPRYDKQEPIMFAVNQIRSKGLNRDKKEEIVCSKPCIKKQALTGVYTFLMNVLTDEQLQEIQSILSEKYTYHTQKTTDLIGGQLPEFINFSGKNVLASKKDLL